MNAFFKNLIFFYLICVSPVYIIICIAILWRGHLYIDYEIKILKLIPLRDMYQWIYIIAPLCMEAASTYISVEKRDVTLYHILAQMKC